MQREEKQQEAILDAIIMRVNEIKNSIGHMIMILETQYESINWPSFLDNFALLSSHVSYKLLILAYKIIQQYFKIAYRIIKNSSS